MKIKTQENGLFGNNIRMERLRLGLTQSELAELGGVSKTSQVSYEAGASRPDSQYLSNVAKAGINISWLLTGQVPEIDHWDLVESIMELIEEWAQDRKKPTSAAERSALFRVLYEQFRSSGSISASQATATFRLIQFNEHKK